jgi:DnaK suppressor protein
MARATTKAAAGKSSATKKATKSTSAKSGSKGAAKANGLDKFMQEQLEALEQERSTYLRQAESLQAEADSLTEDREPGDVQFDEESGEGDTLAVERERDLALSAQARAAIEDIDRAVERIYDGSYGQCDTCGTAIPKERLRALPHAALCVQCKSGGLGLTR